MWLVVCRSVAPPILQIGDITNHLGVCPQHDIQYDKLTAREVGVSLLDGKSHDPCSTCCSMLVSEEYTGNMRMKWSLQHWNR